MVAQSGMARKLLFLKVKIVQGRLAMEMPNGIPQIGKQRPNHGQTHKEGHDSTLGRDAELADRVRPMLGTEAILVRQPRASLAGGREVQALRGLSFGRVNDLAAHPCSTPAFCYSRKSNARFVSCRKQRLHRRSARLA